jgi:hypothetical protein
LTLSSKANIELLRVKKRSLSKEEFKQQKKELIMQSNRFLPVDHSGEVQFFVDHIVKHTFQTHKDILGKFHTLNFYFGVELYEAGSIF